MSRVVAASTPRATKSSSAARSIRARVLRAPKVTPFGAVSNTISTFTSTK
jgi:hypothetical protein